MARKHRRPGRSRTRLHTGAIGAGMLATFAVGFGVTQVTGWPLREFAPAATSLPTRSTPGPTSTGPDPDHSGPLGRAPSGNARHPAAASAGRGRTAAQLGAAARAKSNSSATAGRAGSAHSRPPGAARTGSPERLTGQVIALVNARRAEARCAPVRVDRRLQTVARQHSADMAARRVLDPRSASGAAPWEQAWAQGYFYYAGSAIGRGQGTAGALLADWIRDPQSESVLMDCGSTAVGVAAHPGADGPWWTAVFGYRAEGR